jgi:phage antirepressor YoqD-like protein
LRPLTLTQIAKSYGMKKQSLGRWIEDDGVGFKDKFPTVKTSHMSFE